MSLVQRLCRCAVLRGALPFIVLTATAVAQDLTWIRQLGTLDSDIGWAVEADGSGGAFLGGSTFGSLGGTNAGSRDAWLARYDAAGNQAWLRQFGTAGYDHVSSLVLDGAGGFYAGGGTGGDLGGQSAGGEDAWLGRYDGAGNPLWIQQIGTSAWDWMSKLAPDGAGGVFITGETEGFFGMSTLGCAAWVAHYDGLGNQSWLHQFGSTSIDTTHGAAPDGSGGVFICGDTYGSIAGPIDNYPDAWLAHYDGAGNQTWARQLSTIATGQDATSVASDGSGGVLVTGYIGGTPTFTQEAWMARYDSAGTQIWYRRYGANQRDVARGLAPDGSGGAFATGVTNLDFGGPNAGGADAWVAHYDAAGSHTWIRQLGTSSSDYGSNISSAGSRGLFVVGLTSGSLGGPSAGNRDAWFARIDDNLGATQYCSPSIANSLGVPGMLLATGNRAVSSNDLTLTAWRLPPTSFGYFLASQTQDLVPGYFGSQGILCLGGALSRFNGAGQVMDSGPGGSYSLVVDLTSMPTPLGVVVVQPGETWNFQAWHRDANPGPTSNFTDAVSVTFQ